MKQLKVSELAKVLNGKLFNVHDDVIVSNIRIKLQHVRKGDLYIALVNGTYDCYNLVKTAYDRGAAVVIVPQKTSIKIPQIIVSNPIAAFTKLCIYYRNIFNIPVIAVTGSCGKTSTKDMITSVLVQKFKNISATHKSYNTMPNIISRILSLNNNSQACVLEIGFSGYFGQIKKKVNILRPTIAVITNISTGHFQHLLSKEKIMIAKMEITSYFNNDNILIINGDDEYLSTIKDKPYRVVKISTMGKGNFNAKDIVNLGEYGVEFKCNYKGKHHLFKLNVPGVHNVYNALAAIAVGDILGLDVEQVKKGISNFKNQWARMNIIKLKNKITIINDCFNANIKSMKSALDVLGSFKENRKIAVLGDMLELGMFSEEYHREIGKYLLDKCDMLVAVGVDSKFICKEVKDKIENKYFRTNAEASNFLKQIIKENDVILVKGSRNMRMEYIVEHLKKSPFRS